ncbi:MAG: Dyp-type peroxidase [Magnetovibrio sp.]|nr:Dyp-type peroxidase [Magnetovibrio sp.]
MNTPQQGIFVEGNRYLHVLEYSVQSTVSPGRLGQAVAAGRKCKAQVVFAFGPQMWAQVAHDKMPSGFTDFQPLNGPKMKAPATQRDIMVWIHSAEHDDVLDAVLAIDAILSQETQRELDIPGFVYQDSRDLTGFIDGSANPKDDEAKREAALVPDGRPGAGGAIVFSQKWNHNLPKFNALPVTDQERVIGRTKEDSIELEGDAQPSDSHVSRTDLKVDGIAQKMYRRSFPYGTAGEHGLYFLAFACEQSRFETVLASMWGMDDSAITDHLLNFSTPVTGSYWFTPCEEDLDIVLV